MGILLRNKALHDSGRPSSVPVGDHRLLSPTSEATLMLKRSHSIEDVFLYDEEHVARINARFGFADTHIRDRARHRSGSEELNEEDLWRHIYDVYERVEKPKELVEVEVLVSTL